MKSLRCIDMINKYIEKNGSVLSKEQQRELWYLLKKFYKTYKTLPEMLTEQGYASTYTRMGKLSICLSKED